MDRPTSGTALVFGKPYVSLDQPLRKVGALLDARGVHPGRTAYRHLLAEARTHGIPRKRVDEVLSTVGLRDVAGHRCGGKARYFDIIKDRLYIFAPRSVERRSAQTALYRIADSLCRLLSPILAFYVVDGLQACAKRAPSRF